MPEPIKCGCGASHTAEHPHFGTQERMKAKREHALRCAWDEHDVAMIDKVYPVTEHQGRGGATNSDEAIREHVHIYGHPNDAKYEQAYELCDVEKSLLSERDSLRAQLADCDAQITRLETTIHGCLQDLDMTEKARVASVAQVEAMRATLRDFANPDHWRRNDDGEWVWHGFYPPFERPAIDLLGSLDQPHQKNA